MTVEQKTFYLMVPPELKLADVGRLMELMYGLRGITLFDSVQEGREAVLSAGNDPDDGLVVGITLTEIKVNGVA